MGRQRFADLIVLALLAGGTMLYCIDAAQASTGVLNLILVLPVSLIVLVLCSIQFFIGKPSDESVHQQSFTSVAPVVGLFVAYVISLPWLGFDIGTAIFVGAFLALHGERRWVWVLGYSISFALVLSLFFSKMLPYPMPMLLLNPAF